MHHSVLKQAHHAEEALGTGSTLSDSQAENCSSRNASAKAQRALESFSKLQKPPRKQISLHSPRETPFVPQHPGFPTIQSKTKASLTALTQSKPLPLLLHIFIKYAILFWQLHVRFHAFFFLKRRMCVLYQH